MRFTPSAERVASMSARAATASFFSLRSRTMAVESRPRPGRTSLRCPSSQLRAAQARGSAWLSATESSSNGITEKSTSARVRMAHNLTCGCRLNRPRTLSLSERRNTSRICHWYQAARLRNRCIHTAESMFASRKRIQRPPGSLRKTDNVGPARRWAGPP